MSTTRQMASEIPRTEGEFDDKIYEEYLENLNLYDRILMDYRLDEDERKQKLKMLRQISDTAFSKIFGDKTINQIMKDNKRDLEPAVVTQLAVVGTKSSSEEYTAKSLKALMPNVLSIKDSDKKRLYLNQLKKMHVGVYEELYGPVLTKKQKSTKKD